MRTRLLHTFTLIAAVSLLAHCGQVPSEDASDSSMPSSSSSSSGAATGAPLNGAGQALVGGTRLKVQYVLGEDGSKQIVGFRDTALNFGCTFYPIAGGGAACMPVQGLPGSAFAALFPKSMFGVYHLDSDCTQPAAASPPGSPMDYVIAVDTSAYFEGRYEVTGVFHTQQAAVSSDGGTITIYATFSGTCSPTVLPASYVVYARGQEVPLSSLAQGQINVEP